MRNHIKRFIPLLLAWMLCLPCVMPAQADRLFGDSFAKTCDLPPEAIYAGVCLAVVDQTVYQLMQSGEIYAWSPHQNAYALYTHVPPRAPVNVEIPLMQQSESIYRALSESVGCLIPSNESLYGLNPISGMIGRIDEDGWHLHDVRLDTSALARADQNNGYPIDLRNAYIENGMMYAFHDIHLTSAMPPQTTLLSFDLSSGSCSVTAMPNTIEFCRYTPGKLLCLCDHGTQTLTLSVYDIASQQFSALHMVVPISIQRAWLNNSWELRSHLGGLAYDPLADRIYLADAKGLWGGISGTVFQRIHANEIWEMMMATAEAWTLSTGEYVTQNGWPYYVKP